MAEKPRTTCFVLLIAAHLFYRESLKATRMKRFAGRYSLSNPWDKSVHPGLLWAEIVKIFTLPSGGSETSVSELPPEG